jgi:hypothetical protein
MATKAGQVADRTGIPMNTPIRSHKSVFRASAVAAATAVAALQSGFALPANGSFDLFVPANRENRDRIGKVTRDNGTETDTDVKF